MMDSGDDIAVLGLLFVTIKESKKRKPKRQWCKKWFQRRNQYSDVSSLKELSSEEPLDFLNYLQMSQTVYEKLLLLVSPLIKKQETVMRPSNNST
jgi:hypothetical protein